MPYIPVHVRSEGTVACAVGWRPVHRGLGSPHSTTFAREVFDCLARDGVITQRELAVERGRGARGQESVRRADEQPGHDRHLDDDGLRMMSHDRAINGLCGAWRTTFFT